MSKIIFLFVAIFITVDAHLGYHKDHPYNQHYAEHMKKFGIDHESLDLTEVDKREKTFLKHMKYYDEHNKNYPYHKVGPTPFSDREPKEVTDEICRTERQPTMRSLPVAPSIVPNVAGITAPPSLDYRPYINQILNQGGCGSCWAFSTMSMLGIWNNLRTNGAVNTSYSPQFAVDCDTTDNGCNGGWPTNLLLWLNNSAQASAPISTEYPYTSGTTKVRNTCNLTPTKQPLYFKRIYEVNVLGNVELAKLLLYIYGPMVTAIYAPPCTSFMSYKSGVYVDNCGCPTGSVCNQVNHGVVLVGYGTDQTNGMPYWLLLNSWGPNWGEGGYIRMYRDPYNRCNPICFLMGVE
ncbi:hypothetical protein ACKWTF_003194 [Chironomus riparius]